jgi:hypothetical protein
MKAAAQARQAADWASQTALELDALRIQLHRRWMQLSDQQEELADRRLTAMSVADLERSHADACHDLANAELAWAEACRQDTTTSVREAERRRVAYYEAFNRTIALQRPSE